MKESSANTLTPPIDNTPVLQYHTIIMKQRAPSRKEMVMMNVALDQAVHRQLALISFKENIAMAELVRQAVGEWMVRKKKFKGA